MRNRPHGFDIYLVNVKTMRLIAKIFVAFSEKLNFMDKCGASPKVSCQSVRKFCQIKVVGDCLHRFCALALIQLLEFQAASPGIES